MHRDPSLDELPLESAVSESTTGTPDDEDARDDESPGENEIPLGDVEEGTEAPEEFQVDDEDDLGHPEDDDADEAGTDEVDTDETDEEE